MSNEHSAQELISKQLSQLQLLASLMDKEKEVLQQHKPEALIEVTQKKNELLIAIQSLDGVIAINTQFAQTKAAGGFEKELDEINTLLKYCQQQNIVNGQIIQQSQLAVERMKTTLLENHSKNSMTYNEKGKKQSGLSSLDLKA